MTNSSSGLVGQRYWPLERQSFFKEVCKVFTGPEAQQLKRAIEEGFSGQIFTVNLPNGLNLTIAYDNQTANQQSAAGIVHTRRRVLAVSWASNGEKRATMLKMIANEVDGRFDQFEINLAAEIPESVKEGLLGQRLNRLVELPAPMSFVGRSIIAGWATDSKSGSACAILQQ